MNSDERRAHVDEPGGPPAGFERATYAGEHGDISYTVGGDGPPLVLLHGWPQTSRAWYPVTPALAAAGYTVITPDIPGLGQSDPLPPGSGKDAVAEALHALLRSTAGHEPLRVVGHDIGGMVAFSWGRLHQDEIIRLAIVETGLPGLGLERAMDVAQGGRWHHGFFMTPDVPEMLIDGSEDEFFAWWFARLAGNQAVFGPDEVAATIAPYRGRDALARSFGHYRTLLDDGRVNAAWVEQGGRFAMPVAGIGGALSLGDKVARDIRPVAPDVWTAVIEGAGHFPAEEQPDLFIDRVLTFLN